MADMHRLRGEDAVMTTAMLKALAHPVRRQMMRAFARRDFARAADIAADLGIAPNSASFHLRVLADAGLIAEAPEHARDRRDRVWQGVRGEWQLGTPEHPLADEVLGGAFIRTVADDHLDIVRRVLAWAPEYVAGRTTEVHGTFSQRTIRLTEAEFVALEKQMHELFQAAEEAHDRNDPEGRLWSVDTVAADDTL